MTTDLLILTCIAHEVKRYFKEGPAATCGSLSGPSPLRKRVPNPISPPKQLDFLDLLRDDEGGTWGQRNLMIKTRQVRRIPFKTLEQVAPVLRVLAHPHRLRIVEVLLQKPVPVTELAAEVKLSPAAVSQHLGQMRANGILASRREGKKVYYEVINQNAVNLIGCIMTHGTGR